LLAVHCRAENNRIYLKNGVEMRPGFLARWVEFRILETRDMGKVLSKMRLRFLKESLNQKTAQFDREVMR